MKYMLLIHNQPGYADALSDTDRDALLGEVDAIMAELTTTGELVRGEALADPSQTRTVRSMLAAASHFPSGLNATALKPPV